MKIGYREKLVSAKKKSSYFGKCAELRRDIFARVNFLDTKTICKMIASMTKLSILVIITLNLVGELSAQNLLSYEKLLEKSKKEIYNFDFDSANKSIAEAIKINPNKPDAYGLIAKTHLWYFLGSKNDSDYFSFLNYSDSVIERADKIIDERGEDKNILYVLADVYKNKAMAYGTNGSTLDAFWATKKAVSYFEEILELDEKFYSAYGGIGIFQYVLSYVPALFDWALALSGLSSDKEQGFKNILIAAEKGTIDRIEYEFHLAKLYDEYLADYDNSIKVISRLVEKYPKNILFRYQKAVTLIKSKQLDEAEKSLRKILKEGNKKFAQTNSFSFFLLGDINFRKNNFKEALENYLTFLTTSNTIDYTGIASLRVAYCYFLLDSEIEAKKYLLLAANGNLDLEDDNYAKEKSLKILQNGFSEADKDLLSIQNFYLSGNNQKLIEHTESLDSVSLVKNKAEIYLYLASSFIDLMQYKKAEEILSEFDTLEYANDSWIEPMSYFFKAKLSVIKKEFEQAEEFLEEAEDSNDFQKKNLIASYINGLKKKLQK